MSGEVKSCLYCEHCVFEEGGWLSDVTYDEPELKCRKGHFRQTGVNPLSSGEKGWTVRFAGQCEDYELDGAVAQELERSAE